MTFEPEQLGQSKTDLAEKLRELRKAAGLTGDRLAKRCNMSQSQISKFETGKKTPKLVDVERILRALDAPPELITEVAALARIANTEWQDKRSSWRRGLEKRQAELAALETEATALRYFLPAMVTGLLATPEYVRASLSNAPGDKSKTVARKLERQAVLYDTSKSFTFLLTEQAVRWAIVPPPVMAVQIDRLASLSHLPNVRVGVIPFGVQIPRGPMNTFTVYDDRLATVENFTGRMVFQDSRDVAEHLAVFATFERHALFGPMARQRLSEWAETYRA
ncbi:MULTISPECIES: helix-turn-helix transcriptional regulator [unclassified Streptomyces]|uniref:helix-turn-helix domain-containing protein n=1 Tax=unclassified Streptomyces TaxID=2593676 RepID=UPI001BE76C71|nr:MULTISPECIES: helix-turn-helix transcriptional regulator [unclassified Streptomyces]MBT2403779.1 helix-turn-helix transcriptional regulator [Streptomyces sp. ISL-21]MBT2611164.1 helix-turn-helix transcriptional regulator [Streptomyces sp. ISL-87]